MKVLENISIKPYNTFNIDVKANIFIEVNSVEELKNVLKKYQNCIPLGGGSNFLFTKNIENPIVKINIKGIQIEKEDDNFIWISAYSGENWHQFVRFCIENNWGGLENLSLIPGNVGSSPIQNIGAYGVEIKDVMENCTAISTQNYTETIFQNSECNFGYRTSIFKTTEKGNYIITKVTFKLTKQNHKLNTSYGIIENQLLNKKHSPSIKNISDAIIEIRQSKLPNPSELGNCGSFFKNPIVEKNIFQKILEKHPQMPYFVISENEIKIPAGWLIETCGLKGFRKNDTGIYSKQSLVLINYGNASGTDIYNLSEFIKNEVFKNFGIWLEVEVNIY